MEVFFVGTILGAREFDHPALYCTYALQPRTTHWSLLAGEDTGQTHVLQVDDPAKDFHAWTHPIDACYACSSVAGWPQLRVEVWHQDEFGRNELSGYGLAFMPTSPGIHNVEIVCWRPTPSSITGRLSAALLGGHPTLRRPEVVGESGDKSHLAAESTGTVMLEVEVIIRGLKGKGVEFG